MEEWLPVIKPSEAECANQCFRVVGSIAILLAGAIPGLSAELRPETVESWTEYVKLVDARNQQHLTSERPFLSTDDIPGQEAKLRAGQVIVFPAGPQAPMKVASGLIHDWIGAAFIPNATFQGVLALTRDYEHYKDIYSPYVIQSKLIAASQSQNRFSLVLMNKSLVSKTALDTEYVTSFTCVDVHRCYSITDATRIREIADFGESSQHELPDNHGTGLIWRLHSLTRLEERDGGVYVEIEAVALSRDIPAALRWMVEPIVRRVSRSSLMTSLQQTRAAVRAHSEVISATSDQHQGDAGAAPSFSKASPAPPITSLR
jgi:hypothetical protein